MKLWVNRYLLGTWIQWWIKSLPSCGISNWRDRPNKQNSSLSKPINTWNNYKVWEVLWRKQRTKRKCGTPLVWSLLSEEMIRKGRSEDKKWVIKRWKRASQAKETYVQRAWGGKDWIFEDVNEEQCGSLCRDPGAKWWEEEVGPMEDYFMHGFESKEFGF